MDIQRGSILKRISAALLDFILVTILATGFSYLIGLISGYDNHLNKVQEKQLYYEETYNVKFDADISQLSEEELAHYREVEEIINSDEEFSREYNILLNLTLIMITFSVLIALIITDFVIPLFFKNGMTLGKKIFSLCLVKTNSVKIKPVQLFVRTVLGKFAIELMIPIYIVTMFMFDTMGIIGTIIIIGLSLAQIILLFVTKNRTVIHDLLSMTICVDYTSQKIFDTDEEMVEYIKQEHAEEMAASKHIYN